VKVLLDTHVLLWWLGESSYLSKKAFDIIRNESNLIFISAATAWEISIKKALGKLEAPDTLEDAILANNFLSLPITFSHALLAGKLPFHHEDPFDRVLVAQSKIEGLTLLTRDKKQMLYDIHTILA
jgi:PIN domain nuclease of toxin-antitoxin system